MLRTGTLFYVAFLLTFTANYLQQHFGSRRKSCFCWI